MGAGVIVTAAGLALLAGVSILVFTLLARDLWRRRAALSPTDKVILTLALAAALIWLGEFLAGGLD